MDKDGNGREEEGEDRGGAMGTKPLGEELESFGRLVQENDPVCPLGEVSGERAGGVVISEIPKVGTSGGGGLMGEVIAFGLTSCPLLDFELAMVVTMGTGPRELVSIGSSSSAALLESLGESSESSLLLLLEELELELSLLLELDAG